MRTTSAMLLLALSSGHVFGQSVMPTWIRGADGAAPTPTLVFDNNSSRFNLLAWHRDGPDRPPVLAVVAWVQLNGVRGSMATWDGRAWELYPEIPNPTNMGRSVVFDPDGPGPRPEMVASIRHGAAPSRVVTWDGSAWTSAGALTESITSSWGALTTWDPDGAGPSQSVLVAANQRVSAWNGEGDWLDLGAVSSPAPIRVSTATTFDPDGPGGNPPRLVIGGYFTAVNGVSASNVAIYNGTAWSAVPGLNPQSQVGTIATHDFDGSGPGLPELVIPVRATVSLTQTDLVAWSGSSLRAAAFGSFNQPGGLSYPHNAASIDIPGGFRGLVAFGQFTSFAGSPVGNIGVLNGLTVSPLSAAPGAGFGNFYIDSVVTVDLDGDGPEAASLFACGPTLTSNGVTIPGVARWNGTQWQPVTGAFTHPQTNGRIESISVIDGATPEENQTYLQGSFTGFGGVDGYNDIARSNDTGVSPMGTGITPIVLGPSSVVNFDPDADGPLPSRLFASGLYMQSWNGSAWVREQAPLSNVTRKMCLHDFDGPGPNPPRLIVAAATCPLGQVVQFDGTQWSSIGGGIGIDNTAWASAVLSHDPDGEGPALPVLYAVGLTQTAEGQPVNGAAYFDGSAWHPMGLGASSPRELAAFDTDGPGPRGVEIIVGGGYGDPTPGRGKAVSAWDGSTWRLLGDLNGSVLSITAFDADGDGPEPAALVAAGSFTASGSTALPGGLAVWNPTAQDWSPMPTPDQPQIVRSLAVERPWGAGGPQRLVIGGSIPAANAETYTTGCVSRYTNLGRAWCSLQPADVSTDIGGTVELSAQLHPAYAKAGAQYSWRRNGVPVTDGPGGAAPGGGTVSLASGQLSENNLTARLVISAATAQDSGAFTLVLNNSAGVSETLPAHVTVGSACPADFNTDRFVDFFDYDDYVACFEGTCPPGRTADFNGDGFADFFDYDDFVIAFETGC